VQSKHPDRKCMAIDRAANYIKWLVEQPIDISVNEISVDPLQEA
jgi:NADP-dependent 3-hydroxy acid dehydrogenase YdfG